MLDSVVMRLLFQTQYHPKLLGDLNTYSTDRQRIFGVKTLLSRTKVLLCTNSCSTCTEHASLFANYN